MRRFIIFIITVLVSLSLAAALPFQPESLHYKVMFKWGLINKKAGSATVTLHHNDSGYASQLTAKSEPWADRIYKVRDTLNGRMDNRMKPLFYEKIAHESGDFKHDVLHYDYSQVPVVKAVCTRKVYKKDKLRTDETRELEAEDEVVDMLTSFYYMRRLPFQNWQLGQVRELTIFSGKQKEKLSIKYDGICSIDISDTKIEVYHITFVFTSKGGKKSSDDMDAWITADDRRIPVKLEGKLPVGKVQCIYTGAL